MVGTRTTARDWQWLEDMMTEDAPAEQLMQKVRRMPETYARWRGVGRPRRGGRAEHVPGGSWDVPFVKSARLPTPPASPAPVEQPDELAARGRARRAPRRRGCGTVGHM
ncbi:hypothetical protein PIB30_062732 [Stylosanthes scabra]|uniref:Uncharacterized protein n=1 Tax=Stylosanthes scabra TaxID=79078 RepID=A0ABU6XM02_9FABA|nr:hypothetical protein [Stylosanthes scabra]